MCLKCGAAFIAPFETELLMRRQFANILHAFELVSVGNAELGARVNKVGSVERRKNRVQREYVKIIKRRFLAPRLLDEHIFPVLVFVKHLTLTAIVFKVIALDCR